MWPQRKDSLHIVNLLLRSEYGPQWSNSSSTQNKLKKITVYLKKMYGIISEINICIYMYVFLNGKYTNSKEM